MVLAVTICAQDSKAASVLCCGIYLDRTPLTGSILIGRLAETQRGRLEGSVCMEAVVICLAQYMTGSPVKQQSGMEDALLSILL